MTCNCYVQKLSDYERFVTRYGAHEFTCPVYQESHDPVDQEHDAYQRRVCLNAGVQNRD